MTDAELNRYLEAAREAAFAIEEEFADTAQRLIVSQGNAAARQFVALTKGDGEVWVVPHEDEVFPLDRYENRAMHKLGVKRQKALKAYTGMLPASLSKPAPPVEATVEVVLDGKTLAAAGRRRQPPPGEVGIAWDVSSPFIAPVFERTGEHIASITQTTRAKVMNVIRTSYESGASVEETAAGIRESVRASSLGRAQTIARTEIARLVNGAQLEATKVVGDVTGTIYYKRWLTAPGAEHPRHEDYDGLEGQTVAMDALFDVGGEALDYPGDPDGSPEETCNCRCAMEMVEAAQIESGDLEASAAGLPSDEMEEDNVEQLADGPMDGECANCGHAASAHDGEMNDGECGIDECDCRAMAEASKATVVADGEFLAAQNGWINVPAQGMYATPLATGNGFTLSWSGTAAGTTTSGLTYQIVPAAAEVELPAEMEASETLPAENPSPSAPTSDLGTSAAFLRWTAIFAPEGKATSDGRIFAPGSIGWRALPLSLMAMTETPGEGGHAGAELCGRIDNIFRDAEDTPVMIRADGVFNDDEVGSKVAKLVEDKFLTGNSVDLAVSGSIVAVRSDVVDDEGFWLEGLDPADIAEVDILSVMMGEIAFDDVIFVITEAEIGMSTVCPFPAFAEASISLAADGSERQWTIFQGVYPALQTVHMDASIRVVRADALLTASAAGMAPLVPPAGWFNDPGLDELTPLTVTDDGRVYGHAWQWDSCHIGIQDACTVAPRSETDYAYFLLKEVETDDGTRVECGTITLDTNHAARHLSWRDAASHYDHTGTAIADVSFGEDEHGGWFSGALRPDASAEAVRKFRGATVSGDWRRIHGNLELVGLLTVNVPGFPVPRTKALVATAGDGSEEILMLVAAGIPDSPKPAEVDEANVRELVLLAEQARGGLDDLAAMAARAHDAM